MATDPQRFELALYHQLQHTGRYLGVRDDLLHQIRKLGAHVSEDGAGNFVVDLAGRTTEDAVEDVCAEFGVHLSEVK